jgi:hypothetical protein
MNSHSARMAAASPSADDDDGRPEPESAEATDAPPDEEWR